MGRLGRRRGDADPAVDPEPPALDPEQAVREPSPRACRSSPATSRRSARSSSTTRTGRSASSATRRIRPRSRAAIRRILDLSPEARADLARALPAGRARALELGDRVARSSSSCTGELEPAGDRDGRRGRRHAAPRRAACTLVLPSSGAFDSRTWRIASALAAPRPQRDGAGPAGGRAPGRRDPPGRLPDPPGAGSAVAGLPGAAASWRA